LQQWAGVSTGNGQTTVSTAASGTAVTTGSTLVAICWGYDPTNTGWGQGTVTDNAGNTYVADKDNGTTGFPIAVFRCSNCTGRSGLVLTYTTKAGHSGYLDITALEIAGLGTSPTVEFGISGASGANLNQNGPFTTTHANVIVIAANNYSGGISAVSAPSGYSLIGYIATSNSHEDGSAAYQIYTSTQSGVTITWTSTGDKTPFWVMVGYRP
jgi:hypothetical protein